MRCGLSGRHATAKKNINSGPTTQLMSSDMDSMDEKWWRATKEVRREEREVDAAEVEAAAVAVVVVVVVEGDTTAAPSCEDDDMFSSGRGVVAPPASIDRPLNRRFNSSHMRSYRTRASGGYIITIRPTAIG